ncbi:hypothetical protein [Altererythrobacter lutimaris]|uniref:Uncharacterized protein n=1 Tax=Altererythrobacter lutimaris TaxID=2743979 RepID=A0A850HCM5_9SPHN|nr:hypothetical protein [Altererythrobacter lutimaris]NVE95499.1 hypothetical protein [Altererythrobacter lutimaris]
MAISRERDLISNLSQLLPKHWSATARVIEIVLLLAPFVLVAGLLAAKSINHWQYWHIFVEEDGPIEWLTVLIYLTAFPLAMVLAAKLVRQKLKAHGVLVGILAFGFFFIGMEEISWGQRVLGIATPDGLAEINRQQELNLHNLGSTSFFLDAAFLFVSGYGMTAFLWMPAVARRLFQGKFRTLGALLTPPGFLATFFAPVFFLFAYYVANPFLVETFGDSWRFAPRPDEGYFMLSRDQEPVECIMAIGFLLFTIWLLLLERAGVWRAYSSAAEAETI